MSAEELDALIREKRAVLRAMKREKRRRVLSGNHTWGDRDATVAIKQQEAEIQLLKFQLKQL